MFLLARKYKIYRAMVSIGLIDSPYALLMFNNNEFGIGVMCLHLHLSNFSQDIVNAKAAHQAAKTPQPLM